MKLPLGTDRMRFLCIKAAEPVLDFQTKRPRATKDGEPMFEVQLVAICDEESSLMTVRLVGDRAPKVTEGTPVVVSELVALPWEIDGRSGISYRASRVEALPSTASASSSRTAS